MIKVETGKSISNDLPEKTLLWRVIQDHQNKELLFLGTEFEFILQITQAKIG